MSNAIRRKRWSWTGYVLRMERNNDGMVAVDWQAEGRKESDTTKDHMDRTVEKECRPDGAEARGMAEDTAVCRASVAALCAS